MRSVLIGFVLMLAVVSPVRADFEKDLLVCERQPSPQAGIAACTRLLLTWQTTDSKRAITYYNRGNAYRALKKYRQAIANYDHSIRLNPLFVYAYINRGVTYRHLRQYQKAIANYKQAVRLDPKIALTYLNRANAYVGLNKYRKAIDDYDQAIRLNPRYAKAYYYRGLIYQDFYNNRRQAIADYRAAYKLEPWRSKYAAKLRGMGVEP